MFNRFRLPGMQMLQNRTNDEATSLERRNFTKDDEGVYICTAKNPLGSDSYEVQVTVIGDFFKKLKCKMYRKLHLQVLLVVIAKNFLHSCP